MSRSGTRESTIKRWRRQLLVGVEARSSSELALDPGGHVAMGAEPMSHRLCVG